MRTCSICVCGRREVSAIDEGLVRGVPLRDLAVQYGTSASALVRHKRHLSQKVIQAHQRNEAARVRDLRSEARVLLERAMRLLDRAEDGQDVRAAATAMREARESLRLALQLDGELGPGGAQVQVAVAAQVNVEADRQRAWEIMAGHTREMSEPLKTMYLDWLRDLNRRRLDREVEETRRRLDGLEPPRVYEGGAVADPQGAQPVHRPLPAKVVTESYPEGVNGEALPPGEPVILPGDVEATAYGLEHAPAWLRERLRRWLPDV